MSLMTDDERPEVVATGVPGLDNVLRGGFLRGGFYLVQGDPGSGKTTVALQFLIERRRAGERCLYVSLTESRRDLESACAAHEWSLDGVDVVDLSRSETQLAEQSRASVFHPADTELSDVVQRVFDELQRAKPMNVVFDGLSEIRLLAGEPLRYRRILLSFKEMFVREGVTALLLDDRTAAFHELQPESLVGGNIVLERFLPAYGRARRRMHVTKVRGAHFREGFHDYEIVTGGVVIHPRLVAGEHHGQFDAELCSSGVPNLDAMLCGGLAMGSSTLLLGPAGAGKSTASMLFVVSALTQGRKAAVYTFDEVLSTLIERSEKLCIGKAGGLQGYVTDGLLHLQQVDPAELSPGAFAHEVRRAVDGGAKVIVIDSLNGYLNAMPEERFLTRHLHEMFAYLNQKGVLTIMVVAQHGTIGVPVSSDVDVSYLADTVLSFRYFEASGEVRQAVSVFKKRTGPHQRSIRELRISETGFAVGEPLREFRGVLTGIPQMVAGEEPVPSAALPVPT